MNNNLFYNMIPNNLICIDIETIPNKEHIENSVCKILGFSYDEYIAYENKFVKEGKTWFPKPCFHKIVNIGLLFISKHLAFKYIDFYGEDEAQILNDFWGIFNKCNYPTIISYNGKYFDMPVIVNNSIGYLESFSKDALTGIQIYSDTSDTWEKNNPNYKHAYTKYHIDVMDNFNKPKPSLIEACAKYDIPVKTSGHGSHISDMSEDEIRLYCREDIFATIELFGKFSLLNYFSLDEYQTFKEKFIDYKNSLLENKQ